MNKITAVLVLWILSFSVQAIEVAQGQQYGSGQYLTATNPGIGFSVPENWIGVLSGDGEFIMKSEHRYGMTILNSVFLEKNQQILNNLNTQSRELGGGYVFHPVGKLKQVANQINQAYRGIDPMTGESLIAYFQMIFGKHGYAVSVLVIGREVESQYFSKLRDSISRSVKFFKPAIGAQQIQQLSQQQNRTIINQSQNGSFVSGTNSDGQNCSYVSAGGTTFKSCD